MSETDSSPKSKAPDAAQTKKPSLSELLSVCVDNQATKPESADAASSGADAPKAETNKPAAEKSAADKPADAAQAGGAPIAGPRLQDERPVETAADALANVSRRSKTSEPVPAEVKDSSNLGSVAWRSAGLVLAGIGGLIVVLPQFSAVAEQWLAGHSMLRGQAGTMIVGGICLFAIGMVRRAMNELHGSLVSISCETARLRDIAADGHALRSTMHAVVAEGSSQTKEVVQLQMKLKRLIEIVSNPDYTVSIFRLAASVDQLGKQVDVSMKGQFEQFQKRLIAIAEHAEVAEKQLTSMLKQVAAHMKEQHDAQQATAKISHVQLQSGAESMLKQLTSLAKEQHEAQQNATKNGITQLQTGSDSLLKQLTSLVKELQEAQQNATKHGFGQLQAGADSQLKQVTSLLKELHEAQQNATKHGVTQLQSGSDSQLKQITSLLKELHEAQQNATKHGLGQLRADADSMLKQLTGLAREQHEAQLSSTKNGLEQLQAGTDQSTLVASELANRVSELRARIDHLIDYQSESLPAVFSQLDSRLDRVQENQTEGIAQLTEQLKGQLALHVENLQQGLQLLEQLSGNTSQELVSGISGLSARLESNSREHQTTLQQARDQDESSHKTREVTRAALQGLAGNLEQLGAKLEQQARDHQALLRESAQLAQETTENAKSELAEYLEQVGGRIEKTLEARSGELTTDMLEVAKIFNGITTEVRACIEQAIGRTGQAAQAHASMPAHVLPPVEVVLADMEALALPPDARSPARGGGQAAAEPSTPKDWRDERPRQSYESDAYPSRAPEDLWAPDEDGR